MGWVVRAACCADAFLWLSSRAFCGPAGGRACVVLMCHCVRHIDVITSTVDSSKRYTRHVTLDGLHGALCQHTERAVRQAKKNSRPVSEKDGVCRGGRSEDSTARSVLAGAWRPLRAYSIFSRSPTELLRALPWFSLRSEPICVYELPQVLLAQKNHRKFTSARGAEPRVTQQP